MKRLKIEKLKPNPFNFNVLTEDEYSQLKKDIEERIRNGKRWFTKKVVVRRMNDRFYELVDGHHKVEVCRDLEIAEIPDEYMEIRELTQEEANRDLWSNNIRGKRNPIKMALFLDEYHKKGLTYKEIGERFGLSKSRVGNILRRLENLHPRILEQEKVSMSKLSEREIDQLMRLKKHPEWQLKVYETIRNAKVPFSEVKGIIDFSTGTAMQTKIEVGERRINLGVVMDDMMLRDFNGMMKYRCWEELGDNASRKEKESWTISNWRRIVEEHKDEWIGDKRIDKNGFPAENWNLSELEIDEKTYGKEEVQRLGDEMWKKIEKALQEK